MRVLAKQLLRACADRKREILDLRTCVVVIELARHAVTLPFEQRRDRVAQRRLAAVTDMQRPRRIRRHEFDDDALALVNVAATEAIAKSQHMRDDRATLDRRKSEVDESRTRDVDRRDDIAQRGRARSGNGFGELARILSRAFG